MPGRPDPHGGARPDPQHIQLGAALLRRGGLPGERLQHAGTPHCPPRGHQPVCLAAGPPQSRRVPAVQPVEPELWGQRDLAALKAADTPQKTPPPSHSPPSSHPATPTENTKAATCRRLQAEEEIGESADDLALGEEAADEEEEEEVESEEEEGEGLQQIEHSSASSGRSVSPARQAREAETTMRCTLEEALKVIAGEELLGRGGTGPLR